MIEDERNKVLQYRADKQKIYRKKLANSNIKKSQSKEEIQKIQEELEYKEWANQANKSEQMKENRDEKIWRDLEQTKCSIAEKILKHLDDTLFEMVCKEMGNNFLFQSDNYLTEAGMDEFEDAWFEFYHEHHGDILHQVRQSLAN